MKGYELMEILEIRNDHLEINKTYKCKCPVCGTSFLFDSFDVIGSHIYNESKHMKKNRMS